MNIFEELYRNTNVKKAVYVLVALRYRYFDIIRIKEDIDKWYYSIIKDGTESINLALNKKENYKNDIKNFFHGNEPYLEYLNIEVKIDISIITLAYLIKFFDYNSIYMEPLEIISGFCRNKYGITDIRRDTEINHEGIILNNKFYYYNLLFLDRIDGDKIPNLLTHLFATNNNENKIYLRLDELLSVEKENYIKRILSFSEIYQGREINLDNIEFPLNKGESETLCVYNPSNMNKIQFKISYRKDSEQWIEVEEIFLKGQKFDEVEDNKLIRTKYLHAIYNGKKKEFMHIDGSINLYESNNYIRRCKGTINSHADKHYKLWLIEGAISIVEWGKIVLAYFKDDELIMDAFKGNLIEEVFEY